MQDSGTFTRFSSVRHLPVQSTAPKGDSELKPVFTEIAWTDCINQSGFVSNELMKMG